MMVLFFCGSTLLVLNPYIKDAFCFTCIVQWSEITQTCPICKAPFQAVIHNVNSVDEYTTVRICVINQ